MCLEDIKIMGQSGGAMKSTVVGVNATLIIPADQNRIGIVFSAHTANAIWYGLNPAMVAGEGILMGANIEPYTLSVFTHGDLCRRAWYGLAPGGASTVGVAELFLDIELARRAGYGSPVGK